MTDVNVQTLEDFNAASYFEPPADAVGLFNPPMGGDFIVSVLFKLPGPALPVGPSVHHLFGQNTTPTGWRLLLNQTGEPGNEWGVQALLGSSPAGEECVFPLARELGVVSSLPGLAERLILATMFFRAARFAPGAGNPDELFLFINGDLVNARIQSVPYAPSPIVPRLGVNTTAPQANPVAIVGAAFSTFSAAVGAGIFPGLDAIMGEHFRNCVAANSMSLLTNVAEGTFDFTHRWNARDAVVMPGGPTARAPNPDQEVFTYTEPGTDIRPLSELPDSGNRGYGSNSSEGLVPLVASDSPGMVMRVTENPGWHVGAVMNAEPT